MTKTKQHLGINIHTEDPSFVNEVSRSLLEGYYTRPGESVSQALARAATAYCYGDYQLAQRIYDYVYNNWFMYASPVLSNAPAGLWAKDPSKDGAHYWHKYEFVPREKATGLPISCFAFDVPDTAKGQVELLQELATLSMSGGGTGAHNSIRGTSGKAPGPIPYMKVLDSAIGYFKQGSTRKGAIAMYMDVGHPDIVEHIRFRVPGGDARRRSDNRQQFHNAVNLTDKFINAVLADEEIDLVCPHSGRVYETVTARSLWEEILETRALTGEPFLMKIDMANRRMPETQKKLGLKIRGSNLCVAPETLVLTDAGHKIISELADQEVNVWNGEQFSKVTVRKTGENQELVTVVTDSGQSIDCTPYHKFYVATSYHGRPVERRAHELKPGDKLIKLTTPVIEGSDDLNLAYQNGFYSGDGCAVTSGEAFLGSRIYLYGAKRQLANEFAPYARQWTTQENQDREYFYVDGLRSKYFVPDASYTIKSRVEWFSGLCDADGAVSRVGESQTLQITSSTPGFLEDVQLMLQTLGVSSKVKVMHEEKDHLLPTHDGNGGQKLYRCREVRRLLVSGCGIVALRSLGFRPRRLSVSDHVPQRNAEQFVKVSEVVWAGRKDDTYCFTEPVKHMGVFNGILAGNCSEITLPTDELRTFVCCLSSLNLEKFEEWKDTTIVEDLIRFLDNVLQFFIDNAPDSLAKAKYSAERERALGLGTFGWHSLLQSKGIPFEGGGFNSSVQLTHQVYGLIKDRAVKASKQLAK
ncbi:MAG TPA: LAGLIDADG family homing endonuclease, partial [Methanosarcina sp.]|nr:LAGLIDADG family homing endonuclease [Methanosarcina sp.]